MKAKYVWVALLALTFFGCDDNTGTIGWDMLPDSDQNINGRYTDLLVNYEFRPIRSCFCQNQRRLCGENSLIKNSENTKPVSSHSWIDPDGISFPSVYDPETNPKGVMAGDSIHTAELIYTIKVILETLSIHAE